MQRTSLAAGSRLRVIPCATISASHQIGRPARKAAPAAAAKSSDASTSGTMPTSPQAWIMRTTTGSRSAGTLARSASALMVANDWR